LPIGFEALRVRGLVSLTQKNLGFLTTILFGSRIADEPFVKNFLFSYL